MLEKRREGMEKVRKVERKLKLKNVRKRENIRES